MSTPPLPDEVLAQTVLAFQANDYNQVRTAEALGIARSTLQIRLRRASGRGLFGTAPVLPEWEVSRTSVQRDAAGNVQKEWVTQKPAAGEPFTLSDTHEVKGVSALVGPDGRVIQQWVKTKTTQSVEATLKTITEALASFDARADWIGDGPLAPLDEFLTVYPIADLHMGQYSWAAEAGEDYTMDIASDLLLKHVNELVQLSPPSDTGILLNIGDYFHSDSDENRTRRSGNILDVDTRFARVLSGGVKTMIRVAQAALTRHKRLIIRNIPGNHDPYGALALTVALEAYFSGSDRVTVDTSPSPFFFHRFGKVLLAAIHGDMAKIEDMSSIMAAKVAKDWGETEYRYAYSGHYHQARKLEKGGALVEIFRTLAPKDAWSNSKGFISGREMVAITHHQDRGEVLRVTSPVSGPK